ncbi:MAG TPA: DUF3471 domain-containing protein [Gammaproteobacteria bacterium]|nr:DUF3471 domain-containing protein [Gammaproteobacteria bacterium]
MRTSIHPLVFLLGSLLFSVTWLVLRAPPPPPRSVTALGSGRPAPRPHAERKTIELEPEILRRYAGSYRLDVGTDVALAVDAGKLVAQAEGAPRYELRATSETEFYIPEIDADVAFELDGAGRAVSFAAHLPTGTIIAKRTR